MTRFLLSACASLALVGPALLGAQGAVASLAASDPAGPPRLVGVVRPEAPEYASDASLWSLRIVGRPASAPLVVMLRASGAKCPWIVRGPVDVPYAQPYLCGDVRDTLLSREWVLPPLAAGSDTITIMVPQSVGTVVLDAHGRRWARWSPYWPAADAPVPFTVTTIAVDEEPPAAPRLCPIITQRTLAADTRVARSAPRRRIRRPSRAAAVPKPVPSGATSSPAPVRRPPRKRVRPVARPPIVTADTVYAPCETLIPPAP